MTDPEGDDGRTADRSHDVTSATPDGAGERNRASAASASESTDESHDSLSLLVRDIVGSVLAVLIVGLLLFSASGVWPPLVAVESESMVPHMNVGDLVFIMEEQRFPGAAQHADTGVVTATAGASAGYSKFDRPGDVIVFEPNGNRVATPIIHRAMFWVDEGENWFNESNPQYRSGAENCDALANCPAPHAGFITKGDANPRYDQVGQNPFSGPVKSAWIVGTAEARIPWLGCIRLESQPAGPDCGLLVLGSAAALPADTSTVSDGEHAIGSVSSDENTGLAIPDDENTVPSDPDNSTYRVNESASSDGRTTAV